MEAVVVKNGKVIGSKIKVVDTFWGRLKGLLGEKQLEEGRGLLLRPCRQVHTWFMNFAIDVVFLDEFGKIVGLQKEMEAGQISPKYKRAWQALELSSGSIEKYSLEKGDYLKFLYLQ